MNGPIQLISAPERRLLDLEEACDLRLDGGFDQWVKNLDLRIGSPTTGEK